jgi:hypothetical protein
MRDDSRSYLTNEEEAQLATLLCSHQKLVTGDLVVRDTICLNSSVLTTYHVTQTIALAQEMVAQKD